MVQPIVDLKSGKVTFPKAEAKAKGTPVPSTDAYVAIPKATMTRLASLAKADGFKADAETPKGQSVQTSKACRTYILMAIDQLLTLRKA